MRDIVSWLDDLISSQPLIIVEGLKDKVSLQKLCLKNVITLKGKPLFIVAESVGSEVKECLVLTDLDEHGRKLYSQLKRLLQKLGVKVDDRFRRFLFRETDVRHVEGLYRYVQRLVG
jgi:5S rRNA maturation endonuclease (ribonuclease M5)